MEIFDVDVININNQISILIAPLGCLSSSQRKQGRIQVWSGIEKQTIVQVLSQSHIWSLSLQGLQVLRLVRQWLPQQKGFLQGHRQVRGCGRYICTSSLKKNIDALYHHYDTDQSGTINYKQFIANLFINEFTESSEMSQTSLSFNKS